MSVPKEPHKAVVSFLEMSSMVLLSKSRFYALIQAGIFPRPIRNPSCKRPVFDLELQRKCLEIRRTSIGVNGQPVLFNRKRKTTAKKPCQGRQQAPSEHAEMIEALKSLGLSVSSRTVQAALDELYPDGHDQLDQGEVIRRVFLHLQNR
jgi:hypothetical protein